MKFNHMVSTDVGAYTVSKNYNILRQNSGLAARDYSYFITDCR